MSFAIVDIAGHQYMVSPGQEVAVPGEFGDKGATVKMSDVLMVGGEAVEIGQPKLSTSVTLKVKDVRKSEKIDIRIYRAKSRYRKAKGYRHTETLFTVESIGEKKAAPVKAVEPKKSEKPVKSPAKTK